jgi:hypothetical protein
MNIMTFLNRRIMRKAELPPPRQDGLNLFPSTIFILEMIRAVGPCSAEHIWRATRLSWRAVVSTLQFLMDNEMINETAQKYDLKEFAPTFFVQEGE